MIKIIFNDSRDFQEEDIREDLRVFLLSKGFHLTNEPNEEQNLIYCDKFER